VPFLGGGQKIYRCGRRTFAGAGWGCAVSSITISGNTKGGLGGEGGMMEVGNDSHGGAEQNLEEGDEGGVRVGASWTAGDCRLCG